ncbi:MAG: hypothetical protein NUW37_02285 [Planctomycetes bacterium]|nr:hypothetical protein [Planctomycetota bacterium]
MTLLSGSSTYGKWPEYAQQGTTSLIPVIHHDDGTLEFESPDPSITLSGNVVGDFVTVNFHQVLSDEETSNVFEGNATFTSTITRKPSDDGTGIIVTIDGTYSGSGWLQFYDEQDSLVDYGSWNGTFTAKVYRSIDNDVKITLQRKLNQLLSDIYSVVQVFVEQSNDLIEKTFEDVVSFQSKKEAKEYINSQLRLLSSLQKQAEAEIERIFSDANSAFVEAKKKEKSIDNSLWATFIPCYSP